MLLDPLGPDNVQWRTVMKTLLHARKSQKMYSLTEEMLAREGLCCMKFFKKFSLRLNNAEPVC
jgi:hypothetical protein